jgi:hypothetical protein
MGLQDVEERAIGDAVGLVQDQDRGMIREPELFQDGLHRLDLRLGLGARGVDDVEQRSACGPLRAWPGTTRRASGAGCG